MRAAACETLTRCSAIRQRHTGVAPRCHSPLINIVAVLLTLSPACQEILLVLADVQHAKQQKDKKRGGDGAGKCFTKHLLLPH